MPTFEIIFKPGSASDRAELDKTIVADGYNLGGRFFRFYSEGGPATIVSAADVLQIKEVGDEQ